MRIIWRTLPRLALPAALGLGLAYLGTGFVPRPAPNLRPPEELRARGQGFAEESPVRTILERNVLELESPLFYPSGQAPAPVPETVVRPPAPPAPVPQAQAAFAPVVPSLAIPGQGDAGQPLSGGHSVVGRVAGPGVAQAQPAPSLDPSPGSAPGPALGLGAGPAQSGKAAPAPSLDGVRLVGVIAGGERPVAMLSVDGASVSLGLGAEVRGWTLVAVKPGEALLRHGEQTRRLALGSAQP